MTIPAPEEIGRIFSVAKEFLAEAEDNLERRNFRSAITAAYYAVFHASKAALAAQGVASKSHKGLIQQFGNYLIKPGKITAEHGRTLTDLHDDRQAADYLVLTESLEYEAVQDNVKRTREFVAAIEKIIVS